jgi:hypothetical protein
MTPLLENPLHPVRQRTDYAALYDVTLGKEMA